MFGAGAHSQNRANWGTPGSIRNFYAGPGTVSGGASTANKSAFPDGCRPPICWVLPIKEGGMSSRFEFGGEGTISSANLAGGLYGTATLSGSGDIQSAAATLLIYASATLDGTGSLTADASGILSLAATLAGSGDVTGSLNAVLQAVATLSGSGALSADIAGVLSAAATLSAVGSLSADISGALSAEATLAGSGTLSADIIGSWSMIAGLTGTSTLTASVAALGNIVATLQGEGSVSAADLRAIGNMAATITVAGDGGELTAAEIAAEVWNSLVASLDGGSGTMAKALIELHRLAGLDPTRPLVVTKSGTSVSDVDAGAEIHQDVVETSTETTVTRN